MEDDTVLYTNNLTKRYGAITAVENLCLNVQQGDIFGFLGPNGAGKSTAIRMILGLVKPTNGEIRLFQRSLQHGRKELLTRIGALVEKPSFYEYLTARRNLEIFDTLARGLPDHRDIERVLEIVALEERADNKVKTYSHGMKQRLGVAQALLGNPELILFDEPTSGLDPKGIKEIRSLMVRLAEQGLTVFLSSHILHEVEQICGKMAIINRGRLVVEGRVEDLLHSEPDSYTVKVNRPAEAASLLEEKGIVETVTVFPDSMKARIKEREIPIMVDLLVRSGFEIFAIQPNRSLEDYYLSILETDHG